MPNVTVLGAHGETITLPFDTNATAQLAAALAANITAGVLAGTIRPYDAGAGAPPGLPHGTTGELVIKDDGLQSLPTGYNDAVISDGARLRWQERGHPLERRQSDLHRDRGLRHGGRRRGRGHGLGRSG